MGFTRYPVKESADCCTHSYRKKTHSQEHRDPWPWNDPSRISQQQRCPGQNFSLKQCAAFTKSSILEQVITGWWPNFDGGLGTTGLQGTTFTKIIPVNLAIHFQEDERKERGETGQLTPCYVSGPVPWGCTVVIAGDLHEGPVRVSAFVLVYR